MLVNKIEFIENGVNILVSVVLELFKWVSESNNNKVGDPFYLKVYQEYVYFSLTPRHNWRQILFLDNPGVNQSIKMYIVICNHLLWAREFKHFNMPVILLCLPFFNPVQCSHKHKMSINSNKCRLALYHQIHQKYNTGYVICKLCFK